MEDKIKKIINIIKNLFIFIGSFIFVSIWLTIFKEISMAEIKEGNFSFGILLRCVGLIPLFVFCMILAFKVGKGLRGRSTD